MTEYAITQAALAATTVTQQQLDDICASGLIPDQVREALQAEFAPYTADVLWRALCRRYPKTALEIVEYVGRHNMTTEGGAS